MKKKLLYVLYMLCGVLCNACEESSEESFVVPSLEVDSKSMYFGEEADTKEIEVTSNVEWVAAVDASGRSWCHMTVEQGKMIVRVDENTDKDMRRASIEISASELRKTIEVAQLGWGKAILVSPKDANVEAIGGNLTFEVTANIEYAIRLEDGCNWVHLSPQTRGAHDMVTNVVSFKIDMNEGEVRATTIWVTDKDEDSEIEPVPFKVNQKKLGDTYESTGMEGLKEDIKVLVSRAEANKQQSTNEGAAKMIDGDMKTIYHSPYNNNEVTEQSPAILTYYFDSAVDMDYLLYYPRADGGTNGVFKEVEVKVLSNANARGVEEWQIVATKNLNGSTSASRIDFPVSQIGVTAVQVVVKSGVNELASCAEMEFYKKNPDHFDYATLFTDASCSQLKAGVTEQDIQNCTYSFFKNIAYFMYHRKYPQEFRIAEFKAYPHPSIQQKINKTGAYSLMDNPAGIYVTQGQELVVLVADTHGETITLRVQNLDVPGGNGYGGDSYPLTTGINKLKMRNKGLVYVMYHTQTLEEVDRKLPVKIHFASGQVNGYFDSQKHEASRWNELLNSTVCGYFDVLGKYAHLTFPVNRFRTHTGSRGKELIDLYDKFVEGEQIFLGLKKYGGMFQNRLYFHVVYTTGAMYAADNHTYYPDDNMPALCDPTLLSTTSCWGPAHEVGHVNQTRPGLKWVGTTEVTNNIMSQYIQTVVLNNASRLQTDGCYPKAWSSIIASKHSHLLETDFFFKLVPFWQLQLYFGKVKGLTPTEANGWDGFYPQVYEYIRKNPDLSTDSERQLEFAYICSKIAKMNLTSFFTKWGFLAAARMTVDDYGTKEVVITQEQVDAVKARIKDLGYPELGVNIEYITDNNVDEFEHPQSVKVGTATRKGGTITLNGWANVLVFEVMDGDKVVYVADGVKQVAGFTVTGWKDSYKVFALSAKERMEVILK
ncbi:M60 family metallopeptidase [Bacteroides faecium]|uniref:Peptidase M60 domain-containing protein n=1 Tax=Bacteroides faecium TaxID=2715212 RepID=A0A6H0KIN5_9BACE|nr:M60 family metallopeptidase [Bacteroides faecium]QIU93294.1 hypothetical protein BacF7301_03630 [Bacteroides faecium]